MTQQAANKPKDLSLTGNVYIRFGVIGFMYFSQGLPLGLFGVALPTYFAEIGFTKSEIALYITVIGLPWAFKFLAGPMMDRFSFLIYGHRRPWVVIALCGLAMTFACSSIVSVLNETDLMVIAACGFMLNLFSSTQDVAVDGMAIGVLAKSERSKATALMFGGQSIGRTVGAVGGGLMLGAFGISGACMAGALVVFALMLLPVTIKERAVEKRFPWSQGGQIAPEILALKVDRFAPMIVDLAKSLCVPISLIFIVASFCDSFAGGLLGAYLPPFAVIDLGWDDNFYNWWFSVIGLVATATGLLLSPIFDHYGQRKCLLVLCVVAGIGIIVFTLTPSLQQGYGWQIFMLGFWVTQHLFAVLIISSCMELVSPRIAASQFAIYMSIANLSSTFGNNFIANVADSWSVEAILGMTAVLTLIAPVFFWYTKLGIPNHHSRTG